MEPVNPYNGYFSGMPLPTSTSFMPSYTNDFTLTPDLSSQGFASLGDIASTMGWGEAARAGLGRVTTAVGDGLGQLGTTIGNSRPVQSFLNMPGTDQLNAIAGGITALNGVWNGYNQNKMAKKQFNFQKDVWNQQWGASKQQYNTGLEDRQRARVASNPNAYQSVSSYMDKYGLK